MNILELLFPAFVLLFLRLLPSAGKSFRIVGGHEVSTVEYPFVVRLEKYDMHWCGGSIIHKKFVLTAAHCVDSYKYFDKISLIILRIRVGSDRTLTGGILYEIQKVYPHEQYDHLSLMDQYDIALVKTVHPFRFGKRVAPIGLADSPPKEGDMAVIVGYGKEDVRRSSRRIHMKAIEIPIISHEDCEDKLRHVAKDMICAGKKKGHDDSCQGDSGGPLIVDGNLAGIVAWGIGCGREGFPGVYTNVVFYRKWIKNGIESLKQN